MIFCVSSCLLCPIILVILSYAMYGDKIHKKLVLCLESKLRVNVTKRARFAIFAVSIVEIFAYCSNILNEAKSQDNGRD